MKTIYQTLLLTAIVFYTAPFAEAQISVSGSNSCNTTYSTLKGACDCLNSSSQSGKNIAISVTGNTTESATISITGAAGMWTSLTIKPSGGSARSITASSLNAPLIQINGGDKVVIDGLNTGSNTLTIDNPSTGTSATAITYSNDATYDTIRNTIIKGSGTNTTGTSVVTFDQGTGSTGNDFCYISSCKIGPSGSNLPVYCITAINNTTSTDYVSIVNSEIYDYFSAGSDHAGIYLYTNGSASNWTFSGNSFYQTSSRSLSGSSNEVSAIRINGSTSGNGFVISNNYVGGSSASSGGSATTYTGSGVLRAFRLSVAAGTTTSIQGNVVRNISFTSSSASTAHSAMSLVAGAFDVGTTAGNTIGQSFTTNSIGISLSNASAVFSAIGFSTGTTLGNSTIQYNTICGISLTSSTGILKGIWLQGSTGVMTVSDNAFGDGWLTNGINSASNNAVYAIHATNSASGQHTVYNNYFYGITNSNVGTSNILTGILISGTGSYSVKNNRLENFYCSSRATGTGSAAALIGISAISTGNNDTISGNMVHDLYEAAPSQAISIIGIHCNFNTATGCAVAKNNIYSFSIVSSSTLATVTALNIAGGTTNYYYNAIQMGELPSGLDIELNCILYGINESGGTNNFYNNTVWMAGVISVSSSAATYTFISSVTVNTRTLKNNIFINNRYNGSGGSAVHTVYRISGTNPTGLTSDYNIYYSNSVGSGGRLFMASSNAYTSLKAFREVMYNNTTPIINDLHSGIGNPNLISPNNGSCCVDLHIQSNTPCEGMGVSVGITTTDYEGDVLSSNTPTDIGADAGTYSFGTSDDIYTPNFSFTNFASTSITSNRTLTVAITDQGNGIIMNPSGNAPRIWWRRSSPSTSSWFSKVGTFVSGNANSAVYNFTIDYAANSITPTVGDSFAYYIVAMDSISGNVWYSSFYGASHSNPTSQTTAPSKYTAYKIVSGVSGNYNIGTGQTYTTLTGASGFFNFVNNNAVSGNVTATVISDLAEDGTNGINQFLDDGNNTYTLAIQSDGTLRTIQNSANLANKMIRIDGADRVIIEGGNKKLKFRNTHSTSGSAHSTIMFTNGAISDTLRNCIVECNTTQSNNAVVYADINGTNSVYISSNHIRSPTGGTTNFPSYGFLQRGASYINLVNNEIFNWTTAGIYYSGTTTGNIISGNSVYDTATISGSTVYGIQLDDADSFVISGNYIGGTAASCGGSALTLSNTSANFYGIYYNSGIDTNNYCYTYNNTIQNINLNGSGATPIFIGINAIAGKHIIGNSSGSGNTIGHATTANSIAVGSSSSTTSQFVGISYSSVVNQNISISSNTIANISVPSTSSTANPYFKALANISATHAGSSNDSIYNNIIHDISSPTTYNGIQYNLTAMYISAPNHNQLISGNTIYAIRGTATGTNQLLVTGLYISNTGGTLKIIKNRIYDISNAVIATTGTGAEASGMVLQTSGTKEVYNNQIYLDNSAASGGYCQLVGIYDINTTPGTSAIYYNSVAIAGTRAGGSNADYCYRDNGYGNGVKIRNNLLYYSRGNGLSIYHGASTNILSSDYNFFVYSGTNKFIYNAINYTSFNSYITSTYLDINSWATSATNVPLDSMFTNATNGILTIKTSSTQCWFVNGKGIAGNSVGNINTDFAGDVRGTSFGYGTDIGSDEFTPSATPPSATASGSPALNTTTTYIWGDDTIAALTWGGTGTVPSSVDVKYYTATTPPNNTQNGTRPNAKYMNCYWQLLPTGGSGFTYNIKLYFDSALIGSVKYSSERRLMMAKKNDSPTAPWVLQQNTGTYDSIRNYISAGPFNSFSVFAASDSGDANFEALPVHWLGLHGKKIDKEIQLDWECILSAGGHEFIVEQSLDGSHFTPIEQQPEILSSNHTNRYNYNYILSSELLQQNGLYYRVKAYNVNEEIYSPVCYVSFNEQNPISVFPQPANNMITLTMPANIGSEIIITDLSGITVYKMNHFGSSQIDVSSLPAGIYMMQAAQMGRPIKISISK